MGDDPLNSFVGGTGQGLVAFFLTWLRQKSHFLGGLPDEMEKITNELEMVASLPEAEAEEGHRGESVRVWRSQLRDAVYRAEEVVDEYVYLVSRSPTVRVIGTRKAGFRAATVLKRNRIANRSKLARKKFEEINKLAQSYRLFEPSAARASNSVHIQPQRFSPVNYGDRLFVGMDREQRALVELLEDGERGRVVVGVKGMGGLGKTTLVYSACSLVKHGFDCCVWLTVSPSYFIHDLVHELFKRIMGSSPVDDTVIAQQLMNEHLKNKRYLIVFDDMWDAQVWHGLGSLLPNNDTGSRIIVTTRLQSVISSLAENRRDLTLSPLSPDHAWDLFYHVAFAGTTCPQDIESSARWIVAKCGGLPLAIVTMARLMASRDQSAEEWSSVEKRFGWYLRSHKSCEEVKRVLLLSFNELPYYLKRCFLYLSIFPQDFVIKKKKLIRLWIAEGLIGEEQSGWTFEEQAKRCLDELLDKNLVESTEKSGKKTYKMHNVMRELALWGAMEEKFLMIHDGKAVHPCCQARRLSIQTRVRSICLDCKGQSHVHSILNFDICSVVDDQHFFSLKKMWSHAKFLRVLDLEGLRISTCPDELNELFNLRYLSLRKTGIKSLPDGLERLTNLETLDLRETELQEIPLGSVIKTILPSEYVYSKYLQRLRHFYAGPSPPSNSGYVPSLGISPPQGLCQFINLETLAHIQADEAFVTNVGKLIQLKKFGITNVREVDGEKLLSSLMKMTTLGHLSITAALGQPLMLESASSSPPASIQKLLLMGTLGGKLPTWITSLKYLTHLRLRSSRLIDDPLPALLVLLSLELIDLRGAYLGKKLDFPIGSFLKLNKLELWDLLNLESISIERGAAPDIREMHYYNCKELRDYPRREDLKYQNYKFDIFTAVQHGK